MAACSGKAHGRGLWASERGGGVVSMGVLGLRGVVRFMIFLFLKFLMHLLFTGRRQCQIHAHD